MEPQAGGQALPQHLALQERRFIPAAGGLTLVAGMVMVLLAADPAPSGASLLSQSAVALYGVLMLFRAALRPYRIDTDEGGIHVRDGMRYLLTGHGETIGWKDVAGADLRVRRARRSDEGVAGFRVQVVLRRRDESAWRRGTVLRGSYRTGGMLSGAAATADLLDEHIRSMRAAQGLDSGEGSF